MQLSYRKGVIHVSFPNIPDINASISLNRSDMKSLLLASIAFEELGLAHAINAEAEKIQFVLGTLPGHTLLEPPTLKNLLMIDKSVDQTLRTVIKNQMILQFKLEDVLQILDLFTINHRNIATVTAIFNGQTISDTVSVYYYTETTA